MAKTVPANCITRPHQVTLSWPESTEPFQAIHAVWKSLLEGRLGFHLLNCHQPPKQRTAFFFFLPSLLLEDGGLLCGKVLTQQWHHVTPRHLPKANKQSHARLRDTKPVGSSGIPGSFMEVSHRGPVRVTSACSPHCHFPCFLQVRGSHAVTYLLPVTQAEKACHFRKGVWS